MEIQEYRGQLYEYLKNRMFAIAPNLTAVVGKLNLIFSLFFSFITQYCQSQFEWSGKPHDKCYNGNKVYHA